MGKLEKKSYKRSRRKNLQKIILGSVAAAGVLSVGLVAPNVLGALAKLGLLPSKRQREFITVSRNRMIAKGLLKYEGKFLCLTSKGKTKLRQLELMDYQIKKPRRWDGKWRALIFDIPEKRKPLREKVRTTLIAIGFARLQDSVWIYPYDCEDLISLLKADFKIGRDLLYMVVESLEYDQPIRSRFGLR